MTPKNQDSNVENEMGPELPKQRDEPAVLPDSKVSPSPRPEIVAPASTKSSMEEITVAENREEKSDISAPSADDTTNSSENSEPKSNKRNEKFDDPDLGSEPGYRESSRPVESSPQVKELTLKNARVGEVYKTGLGVEGLTDIRLEDDCRTGLKETGGRLTGRPTLSGDFVLKLSGRQKGNRVKIHAKLAVIPDPKSLWISKPSKRSAPYWKKDEAFEQIYGDLLCVAASKRGRSHANVGAFREDDFSLHASPPGGWIVAAVADGAGSAKYSRCGSQIAVEIVKEQLPQLLDEFVSPSLETQIDHYREEQKEAEYEIKSKMLNRSLAKVAINAASAIEEEARNEGEQVSAYSTTLIIGVARKVHDMWFIASFAIGDGGMAVIDTRDQSVKTMNLPDSGEFAGQTRFLRSSEFSAYEDINPRLFFDIRESFTAIALMTDGITDPKFPTDSIFNNPSKWMEFWEHDLCKTVEFSRENANLKSQLLEWMDFWSRGNHDDRTLVLLVP